MTLSFSDPSDTSGTRLDPKEILGHLLIVWPTDYIEHSPTKFSRPDKKSDVIVVDIVDLDQPGENGQPGLLARKCWWRQARLIQSLRPAVDTHDLSPKLVRIQKGISSQGMNAPFELISMKADASCVARAQAWAAQNPGFTPSTPQTLGDRLLGVKDEPAPSNLPPASPIERMAQQAQWDEKAPF